MNPRTDYPSCLLCCSQSVELMLSACPHIFVHSEVQPSTDWWNWLTSSCSTAVITGARWVWRRHTKYSCLNHQEPSSSGTITLFFDNLWDYSVPWSLKRCVNIKSVQWRMSRKKMSNNIVHNMTKCCCVGLETVGSQTFSSPWATKAKMARRVFVSSWATCSSVCMAATGLLPHFSRCSHTTPALPVSWQFPIAGSAQNAWSRCAGGLSYTRTEQKV